MDHVRSERDGPLVLLTLDRPTRRNAMHAPMWDELREAARACVQDGVRAVVVTGAGEHFCSGMDLATDNPLIGRVGRAVATKDGAALQGVIRELKSTVDALAELPVPVIAAVEGACLGGGLEVALAADVRVAGASASFSLPETRWGMVPDVGGTVRLSRLIGRARAAQLALTASSIGAEQAERWGLVNETVEKGRALSRAIEIGHQIARTAPTATRETLQLLRSWPGDERFDAETEAGARALLSGEILEGLASFSEKRKARW